MSDDSIIDPAAIARLERLGGRDFLRNMIELYLQHAPARVLAIEEGLDAADAAQIERAAHGLKSSAGNLGAFRLQDAALSLELMGAAGTIDTAAIALVRDEYTASERALRALLQDITS